MFNIPNLFLFYRILAVPLFIIFYSLDWHTVSIIIFITASVSDFFDGYFARKLQLVNDFGKLMDPLADKILTSSAFICFVGAGLMSPWMLIVVISREFLVTGLRGLAAAHNKIIAARFSGKLKTTIQMTTVVVILLEGRLWSTTGFYLGQIMLWATIIITVYSGIEYLWDCRNLISLKPTKKHSGK